MSDDLVAFLRARLDEDEQYAQDPWGGDGCSEYNEPGAPGHHLRVLAEVDAKRRMLSDYGTTVRLRDEANARIKAAWPEPDPQDLDTWGRAQRDAAVMSCWVPLLALPYRDHPDYRPEWAPGA